MKMCGGIAGGGSLHCKLRFNENQASINVAILQMH